MCKSNIYHGIQCTRSRDRKYSVPSDVISPALFDICSINLDPIQAASTPSIFYQADMEDNRSSFHCDSSSNISETSTNTTMVSQITSKFRPNPLKLDNANLDMVGSSDSMNADYDEEDLLTPKILPTSRKTSRDLVCEGPVFFVSGIPDRQPSSQEMKDKIDKAITSGSSYLQLPTAVERRRHSWMSG